MSFFKDKVAIISGAGSSAGHTRLPGVSRGRYRAHQVTPGMDSGTGMLFDASKD